MPSQDHFSLPASQPHDRTISLLQTRQDLTDRLASGSLDPQVLLQRARTYRLLGYSDLAAADAYVALTLAEVAEDPEDEDFLAVCEDGSLWPPEEQRGLIEIVKRGALVELCRCLCGLGCLRDAWEFLLRLQDIEASYAEKDDERFSLKGDRSEGLYEMISDQHAAWRSGEHDFWDGKLESVGPKLPNTGFARREIYAWNQHEPDRTNSETLQVLNQKLYDVAPELEVRVSVLPDLGWKEKAESSLAVKDEQCGERIMNLRTQSSINSSSMDSQSPVSIPSEQPTIRQLGLFTRHHLWPGTAILRERSLLTTIRATDASLCDACAAPLPSLTSTSPPVACEDCSVTVFCSQECLDLATGPSGYHRPPQTSPASSSPMQGEDSENDSDSEDEWPFCANPYGLDDIARDPNSSTPADDLYFLLITRAIALAERRGVHPLELEEVKYLYGEFNSVPDPLTLPSDHPQSSAGSDRTTSNPGYRSTLPFSLAHSVILPLRYFTTLLLSSSTYRPYSAHWLHNYDFWTIQTLYAKFRGVASAKQSTWDGRPEVAAVHWRWCLANHSCAPGVEWSWAAGSQAERSENASSCEQEGVEKHDYLGEIVFRVREKPVWSKPGLCVGESNGNQHEVGSEDQHELPGIPADTEILSHYCDISLPVSERRAWAKGALGGNCRCERCVWESGESRT